VLLVGVEVGSQFHSLCSECGMVLWAITRCIEVSIRVGCAVDVPQRRMEGAWLVRLSVPWLWVDEETAITEWTDTSYNGKIYKQ